MFKPYRTCTVMLHPIALPTDLFQVAAVCAGKSLSHKRGASIITKLKCLFFNDEEKENQYVQEVMRTIPSKNKHIISQFSDLEYENIDNFRYDFEYGDQQTLQVIQNEYEGISQYVFIQPNDIILNFYYFPQFELFQQLIPQAIECWTEQDVRVIEMKKTVNIINSMNFTLQSYAIIHSIPTNLSDNLELNDHYIIEMMPRRFTYHDLGTDNLYLSSKELQRIFNDQSPETIAFCNQFATPLVKNDDWMSQLRVRDNHFRSIHDILMRVLVPLGELCKQMYFAQWKKFIDKHRLRYTDTLNSKVFIVPYYGDDPINPRATLIIGHSVVPVFINEHESHDIKLNSSLLKVYKSVDARDYKVDKLRSQPFYGKQPEDLLYLQLDTEGISVMSFDGDRHLRVTYAKLTEKTLADIFREFTGED